MSIARAERTESARHRGRDATRGDRLAMTVVVSFIGIFSLFQVLTVLDQQPMSFLDEHMHFDTALKLHNGQIAQRGDLLDDDLLQEWACGVGHQAGKLAHGCGDPALSLADLPSGVYTTGYIHYPTYFIGGELFRRGAETIVGPQHPLSMYRMFSAFLLTAGLVACGVVARRLGLRGAAFVAAVVVPAAASENLSMGSMVNPSAATLLFGALIVGTGLHWLRTGRQFGWLLVVSAAASCVAVVASLPAGAVLLAAIGMCVARRWGWRLAGSCEPKLVHIVSLALVLVMPIVVWNQYIEATSTASNEDIYGMYQLQAWADLLAGLGVELTTMHTAWTDSAVAMMGGTSWLATTLRGMAGGVSLWITVLVLGGILITLLSARRPESRQERLLEPAFVLGAAAVLGMVLYPVGLRLSNAITFGIDVPTVMRYSMGFAPMLTIIALILVDRRRYASTLVVLGASTTLAMALAWW